MEAAEDETAAQLFSRLGSKEKLGDLNIPLFSNIELQPGDVVEFCGAEGTGKTELLLYIAAMCILPKSWCGVSLPGQSMDVLLISIDCKLDLIRLTAIMEGIALSHGVLSTTQMKCKELITSSLKHLYIVKCTSVEELVITLYLLKVFLNNHPNVSALLLDNVATFWWAEKAANPVNDGEQHRWTSILNELITEHHLLVIATTPLIATDMLNSHEKTTPDEVLNRCWYKLVKFRFFLRKTTNKQDRNLPTIIIYSQNLPRSTYRLLLRSSGVVFLSDMSSCLT